MVSSQGDRPDFKPTAQPVLSGAEIDKEAQLNTEQISRLIDSVLSFEACLYHQVLPLALEKSCLKLGMVNPKDTAALDYIGRILSYMNYSLVSQPIDADTHRAMLSAYLTGTSKPATERVRSLAAGHPAAEAAGKRLGKESVRENPNDQPTLILAEPEELNIRSADQGRAGEAKRVEGVGEQGVDRGEKRDREDGVVGVDGEVTPLTSPTPPTSPTSSTSPSLFSAPALLLEVQAAAHLSSPIEVLANLPPKNLLQELLRRVLVGGIGRLYFQRKFPKQGRILSSQNGVVQSVLEELPLPVFQEVIDELKRLTHLSLSPVQEPKQVEIERLYQQNRLLLRLRVMPGVYGEEATLQVLRGAALKFYQQQQLTHLSRDALSIAEQLQRKLNELRERARLNSSLSVGQLEALPAVNQLLESIDQHLEALKQLQAQQLPDNNKLS